MAGLILLMHRYLCRLLDPCVSLLEVHKLMYFMQDAVEPMRLQWDKAPFSPYAANLRHVHNAVREVYAWNERERRFSPRQIGIAFNALQAQGWLNAA